MKFAVLFLIVASLTYTISDESLRMDIMEIIAQIPFDQVKKLHDEYMEDVPKYRAAIEYLQSNEWAQMIKDFFVVPPFQKAKTYLLKVTGLNMESFSSYAFPKFDTKNLVSTVKRSLGGFLEELGEIIPYDNIKHLIIQKRYDSEEFDTLINTITDDKMAGIIQEVVATKEYKRIVTELKNMDVPVEKIIDMANQLLGLD